MNEDVILEFARIAREAIEKAARKRATEQEGEAFDKLQMDLHASRNDN
jgi:hypothetical protein